MPFHRIALLFCVSLFLAACAQQPIRPVRLPRSETGITAGRTIRVRTTAYTNSEPGGGRNAVGKRLTLKNPRSAASDWSRFPLGTKFRIVDTGEICQIDDYGSALVGTDTIDLYQANGRMMRQWGVRSVDIAILEWGSARESLEVLSPRQHNRYVRRMVTALKGQAKGLPREMKLQPAS